MIFHSDRGSQYNSDEFRKGLDRAPFIQSFSKKDHPYDNAIAEAFFKFLKLEETDRNSYHSFKAVKKKEKVTADLQLHSDQGF